MTTANCPRCSEQVSVPDSASHEATVRCPFCQDEYSLGEALAQLPPSLIVVSDFAEGFEAAKVDSPWTSSNLAEDDADEFALSPMGSDSAAAFEFTSGSATTGDRSKAAIRPNNRSRQLKGSPVKSILSIVIGGLMAFPIAQLILWYLPGDWKRDFGAGPIVAQYVPQIVPLKFRGSQAGTEANSDPTPQESASVIPDFNGEGGQFAEAFPTSGDAIEIARSQRPNHPKKQQATNGTPNSIDESGVEEETSLEDSAAGTEIFGGPLEVPGLELEGPPIFESPGAISDFPDGETLLSPDQQILSGGSDGFGGGPDELPSREDPPLTTDASESDVAGLAPGSIRNARRVSAEMVAECVQEAMDSNLAWDKNKASSLTKTLKREFYLGFSKLGEALAFADRSNENVATQIAETAGLLQQVSKQSDKLAMIRGVVTGWIAAGQAARTTNGICLAGVVKSVEPIDNFFETIVISASEEIAVISTSDPSEYFVADREVLILGMILEDPAKNLGGYDGSREVVVLDGFHVSVSAE